MKAIIIDPEDLQEIKNELEEIKSNITQLFAKQQPSLPEQYIDNKQFCKLLRISSRSAQNYRDSKRIGFIQYGSKILYKISDVNDFLHVHYKPAHRR